MPRIAIEMGSRTDGDALKRSLEDPTVNVTTRVAGALLELPTVAQRRAVISFVLSTIAADKPPEVVRPRPIEELPAMRLGLGDTGE